MEQLLSSKGSYNIFQNYTLDSNLTFEELNTIFNDYCNTKKDTQEVVIVTNSQNTQNNV